MSKYTRKFNGAVSRYAFWHLLTARLAEFDSLVRHREHLTPEDIRALREIHGQLYECYTLAKSKWEEHKYVMRKEITYEGRAINEPR